MRFFWGHIDLYRSAGECHELCVSGQAQIEQPEVWKFCREGARHPGIPLDAAFVSAAHLSSISTRTALTRRNRASSPGKTQTLTVRRLSSCWTERSIGFEVRSRFR